MAGNLWRRFEALIKPAAEEVVTVTAKHSDGTITGKTLTEEFVRVRCVFDVEVNDKVFVAGGGEAKAKAPNLTYYEVGI